MKPPIASFMIGGCENITRAFDLPCCEGDKPCPLVKHSIKGTIINKSQAFIFMLY